MKLFSLIWASVFLMTAIMDGGDVRPSLAQTGEEDFLPVAISGDDFTTSVAVSRASGRSKGSNISASKEIGEPDHAGDSGGASVWWTWTAPATGPVTFDTRGSNFDTLLAVYTGDNLSDLAETTSNDDTGGTYQSAVRFSAQQGQTYHIAVDGWGGDSGTIVLNWQAPPAATVEVAMDDFSPRVSITGASGRSTGGNVGAGIEDGEPNHAGNSGGASVWWTWTAPAAGPVIFDTRGSDFDTLLAIYTGNSINDLTVVASNDDMDDWLLQSVVRFSAQQGQTYHIAVDGYSGATGAIVLNWRAASVVFPLRIAMFEDPDPGRPSYVIAGQNASVQYWKNAEGAVSQALYRSADETVSVRIFFDETIGLPQTVLDEVSGEWVLLRENGSNSIDFWFYDRDGNYQNGFAVFENSGQYYFGEIAGIPVHAGKQINGHLHPTTSSWTGDFTLEADTGDLINVQAVPLEIAELMDSLTSDGIVRTGEVSGRSQTRFATTQRPTPYTELLRHVRALFAPKIAVAENHEDTLRKGLSWGGMALLSLGLIANAPTVAIAGGGALIASLFVPDVAAGIRAKCEGFDNATARDICRWAADSLSHKDRSGPVRFAKDQIDRGKEALESAVNNLWPEDATHDEWYREPSSDDMPPAIGSYLSGEARRDDDTVVDVEGNIDQEGSFNVTGSDEYGHLVEISGSAEDNSASFSGTFEWGPDRGTVSESDQTDVDDSSPPELTPGTPDNPDDDGCWIPCTPDPSDPSRCLPDSLGTPACVNDQTYWHTAFGSTQFILKLTNNCGGRLYATICVEKHCDTNFARSSLCRNGEATWWSCGATGLRAGKSTSWNAYEGEDGATGGAWWRAVGSNRPGSDWVCNDLIPDWDDK